MAKRKSISKRVRFEVFKRDSFTCQYCGKAAPDVVLHLDHINPVANGGDNDIINLLTSCADCNSGKGAKTLDDNTAIQKQRAQLAELNERREQLEMMLQWKDGLRSLEDDQIDAIEKAFNEGTGKTFTDLGRKYIRKHLKRFGFALVLESTEVAVAQYPEYVDGEPLPESIKKTFNYIPRICASKQREAENPDLNRLYYIRGIARNRFNYCNDWKCIQILKDAYEQGVPIDELQDIAKQARHWTQFQDWIEEAVECLGEDNG